MMMGYCGLMAPLARVTALMKTRAQNWPLETNAEIPVFVLVFAIPGDGAARNKCHVFARNLAATVSLGKTNDLLAEDAVCLQPVSDPNSLLAGNFSKKWPLRAILASEMLAPSDDYDQIPCSKRTGNFSGPSREFGWPHKDLCHGPKPVHATHLMMSA